MKNTCIIWYPHYQSYIRSIKMVQQRAARFVMNKYNNYDGVSQMLDTLGWNTLENRRNKLIAVMTHKIIHKLVDIQPLNYLNFLPEDTIIGFSSYQHILILTSSHFSWSNKDLEQSTRTYCWSFHLTATYSKRTYI